jgi:hypothetical protein
MTVDKPFPTLQSRKSAFLWMIFLGIAGVALYGPGLHGGYFGDDYQFFFSPAPPDVLYYFLHKNPHNRVAYRPFEATALVVIQKYYGMETFPIHVLVLILHVLLSFLIFGAAVSLGYSWLAGVIASAYMLISQANSHAVLSNDTLSQVSGTFFGCMSVWLLYLAHTSSRSAENVSRPSLRSSYYCGSILMFLISLFSKETSISFFPMLGCLACLFAKGAGSYGRTIKKAALLVSPYIAIVLLYFAARTYVGVAGPLSGSDSYHMALGWTTVKNGLLFGFGALTPVSTVGLAKGMGTGQFAIVAAAVVSSAVIGCLMLLGCRRMRNGKTTIALALGAVLGLFPVILMVHVSELYLYNVMPFVSLLVGIAWATFLRTPIPSLRFGMLGTITLALVACHVAAVRGKMLLMCSNGERMGPMLEEVAVHVPTVPDGGELLLVNPPEKQVKYSVFLLPDFWVLDFAAHRIRQMANREDVRIRIVDQAELARLRIGDKTRLVTLYDGHVVVVCPPKTDP